MPKYDGIVVGGLILFVSGIFTMMNWVDGWIFFSSLIVGFLMILNGNYDMFGVGTISMFSAGVFTKMGWMELWIYFTGVILITIYLAQNIVRRWMDIGQTSGGNND